MALPSLDNKTTIGQLSLDDKASIITSLVQSGKLGLSNYGAINFNQNVSVQGTATREGGSAGSDFTAGLNEIKNSILGLTANISEFINKFVQEKQVSDNFMEAVARDVKSKGEERETSGESAILRLQKPFENVAEGLNGVNKTLKEMAEKGGFGGGEGFLSKLKDMFSGFGIGGIMGKLFSALGGALGLMGKSIPILAAGYVLTKLPWGSMAEEGKKLISGEGDLVGNIKNLFTADFSEPGENQDVGDSTATPSGGTPASPSTRSSSEPSGGTPASPSTRSSSEPSGGTPTTSRESTGESTPSFKSTAERSRFDSTTNGDIASESDLVGLSFTSHAHKGLPLKVEKQIKKALAQRLQYIRKKLGGTQLNITSGYRPAWYNKNIKGAAENSQHTLGKAADVTKSGFNQKIFVKAAVESGIGAIGFYDSFIHIDIRPRGKNGRIARWGKIPDWALEYINNPNRYTMGDSAEAESTKTSGHEETEPDENKENTASEQSKSDADTSSKTTPTSASPTKKSKETATQETGTAAAPEEEDEMEETSEKIQTDPSLRSSSKKETASKEIKGGDFPDNIEALFVKVEQQHKLPKGLLKAIAMAETGVKTDFKKRLTMKSEKGALGLMQFLSGTAKDMGLSDRTNPEQSIIAAGKYLTKIRDIIGSNDPVLLAAGYNAGPNNKSLKEHRVPAFPETRDYVKKVASYMGTTSQETMYADKPETVPDNKPKSTETTADQKPADQTTADATVPTQTIGDKINNSFQSTIEAIKNIKDFKESEVTAGIGNMMAEVGSALGFDPSRLNLPKAEAIAEQTTNSSDKLAGGTSKLEMKQTEEAKKLTNAKNDLDQANEIKNKKAEENSKPQQPVVINNNTTTNGGQNPSVVNPGVPNTLEVRDSTPAIHDLTYNSLKSGIG